MYRFLIKYYQFIHVKNLNLENQLIFCEKYSICPNELLLLEIILIAQEGDDPEIVNNYFTSRICARGNVRDSLIGLQEAGVINKSYTIPQRGQSLDIHVIPLNKNIVKDFYKCSFELGKELYETYPVSTVVNGVEYKLRRISKKFNSLEDAYRAYGKAIRWKPDVHRKVIELVKRGIEKNYSFTTLDDFIVDHDWMNMEALSKEGVLANTNMKML